MLALITTTPDTFATHNQLITEALDGFCSLNAIYGSRRYRASRYGFGGEESESAALAREVSFHINPDHVHYGCLWGREYWQQRRNDNHHPLIAWTADKNGRIVRGWKRHLTLNEFEAYDTAGNRSCPIEAAWMNSIRVGFPSLPALPFQRNLDGSPQAEACVKRLVSAGLI